MDKDIRKRRMGKVKNYLRYVHDSTFGLVASSQVGPAISFVQMRKTKDRFVAVSANENVYLWDLKTKQIVIQYACNIDNPTEVSALQVFNGGHNRTNLLAVGYIDGSIRIFEFETGVQKSTFTGHRRTITNLAFDDQGTRLASGSKDGVIVIWDVFGEKGLFSLKGHKNSITNLQFLNDSVTQKDLLISSSIETISAIKFWDLATQHCFRTLPDSSGVWSFALVKDATRLIVGSSGVELKVFSIRYVRASDADEFTSDNNEVDGVGNIESEKEYGLIVRRIGSILRKTQVASDRIVNISLDSTKQAFVCYSSSKQIEFYAVRKEEEALERAKHKLKKERKKSLKRKQSGEAIEEDLNSSLVLNGKVSPFDMLDSQSRLECEFITDLGFHRLNERVKAIAITAQDGLPKKIAVIFATNKIISYIRSFQDDNKILEEENSIDNLSHQSDVRSVAISSDNSLIATCSKESLKIWQSESKVCIGTVGIELPTCCMFAEPKSLLKGSTNSKQFILITTKSGDIVIVDIQEARVMNTIKVSENKPLNYIYALPSGSGIVCGGEDKILHFFNFTWISIDDEETSKRSCLSLEEDKKLEFPEGILCVKISNNMKLIAVSLLDSTVRVHFVDTLKYFLTLYGHKFPVTTMDISDDNTMIATGSPDKNIKIWGLDFGDCHKSLFAHDEAITCVKFVPKTHHLFSCGGDRAIKQWDCDNFTRIQALKKHQAEVWCLDVSSNGKFIVTGSHDKSIRLYRKTEEILVPSLEEENEREIEDEKYTFEQQDNVIPGVANIETGLASKMTVETVKSTDRIMEAIDIFDSEQQKELEYLKQCELAEKESRPKPAEPEHDPLLISAQTTDYHRFMLEMLRRVRPSELEQIIVTLPFDYVRRFLIILVIFIDRNWELELMVRCVSFLLKINFGQIAACKALLPVIDKLKTIIVERSENMRDFTGFNLMALEHSVRKSGRVLTYV